jgi:general secretion pathway protein C
MSSRWTGFFIWALVAASAAFWGIRIFAATRPVPLGAQAPETVAANGPMERLFGAIVVAAAPAAAVHPESERFQLVGVIAPPGGAHGGYAVVAIDGQPARSWPVGATLDGATALLSVSKRGADFGPHGGPAAFSLQLPEPSAAETGTLPPPTSQPMLAQAPQVAPQPNMPGAQPRGATGGPMQLPQGAPMPQNGAGPAHTAEPSDDGESNDGRRRQR